MRRFGWQIGGVLVAVVGVSVLGVLAFGRGGASGHFVPTARPSASASVSATADPRVAQVEEAARRYVRALADSMKTGSAAELDALSVPGSQAEGNAGVAAHVVHDTNRAFVVTHLDYTSVAVTLAGSAEATVTIDYQLHGYDATWPSLVPAGAPRQIVSEKQLEFSLMDGEWLVETER
jgi:hypothetical protein